MYSDKTSRLAIHDRKQMTKPKNPKTSGKRKDMTACWETGSTVLITSPTGSRHAGLIGVSCQTVEKHQNVVQKTQNVQLVSFFRFI